MQLATRNHARHPYFVPVLVVALVIGIASPSHPQGYVVGVGDQLAVTLWGYKELSAEAVVLPDGTVSLPLIGQVEVAGLDLHRAQDRLSQRYAEFVLDPRVTVVVKNLGTITVSIVGAVNKPGSTTLVRQSRALDAIAAAGGLTKAGSATRGQIIRAAGKVIPLDDLEATLRGDEHANPVLEPGDVLDVEEDVTDVATVTGQVSKPGTVVHLRQAPTLLAALTLAGGLSDHAAVEGTIIRKSGEAVPANLGGLLLRGDLSDDVRLQPGDVIVVPEGPSQIFVVGGVKNPGAYRVTGGVSALEALSMAGGVSGSSDGKVLLYRRPSASAAARQLSAASPQAGGQTPPAVTPDSTVETMQVAQILHGDDPSANTTLHPGDVLYVQESKIPSVWGQVVLPILQGITNLVYIFSFK